MIQSFIFLCVEAQTTSCAEVCLESNSFASSIKSEAILWPTGDNQHRGIMRKRTVTSKLLIEKTSPGSSKEESIDREQE